MTRRSLSQWVRPRTFVASLTALAVALSVTAGVFGVVEDAAHERTVEMVDRQAHAVQAAVEAEAQRYVDALRGLAVAVGAQSDLTARDFAAVTSKLDADALMGASGVAFVVAARADEVEEVEARWRARGSDDLELRPVRTGREHRFVVLNRSLDGARALGADLSLAAAPNAALDAARSTGQITTSSAYSLLKDQHRPVEERQPSFALVAPVYGAGDAPDVSRFRGWLAMGLRGEDFLSGILPEVSAGLVDVTLTDTSTKKVIEVSSGTRTSRSHSALEHTSTTDLAGREWRLTTLPTARFLAEQETRVDDVALAGGVSVSVLLSALVFVLLHARDRALARVDAATGALRDDIERRKVVEADLLATRDALEAADRIKSDFVSCVSHELRTPLTSMLGYAEMLADGDVGELTRPQGEMLAVVDRNARRLLVLVEDLLALSRIQSGGMALHPEAVAVAGLADGVVEAVRPHLTGRNLDLRVAVDEGTTAIQGDRGQLERVLLNLVTNAVKYTPDGGRVLIESSSAAGWVTLAVHDTGMGIPADEQAHLFEPFYRSPLVEAASIPGTGLGLVIVKSVTEAHGGEVSVRSAAGAGTTFTVRLPSAAPVVVRDLPQLVGARA